jgi:5-(carboxyamino)imidazole ribonucleotide mutase
MLAGVDSLLSIVQMPKGVPVGTLAIGKPGAANAALLAISILALEDRGLRDRLCAWRDARKDAVLAQTLPAIKNSRAKKKPRPEAKPATAETAE